MAMRVGMVLCFLGLVQVLWELVVWRRIDLRRRGRCRDLGLLLQFGRLPSVLLDLDFRASGFLPNKLDRR